MRGKLTSPVRQTPRQMQKAFICTINQSKTACFCLVAYLRVFVKPKLKGRSSRKLDLERSLISITLASFMASMKLRLKAIRDMAMIRRNHHESSLYWLHSTDPRAI